MVISLLLSQFRLVSVSVVAFYFSSLSPFLFSRDRPVGAELTLGPDRSSGRRLMSLNSSNSLSSSRQPSLGAPAVPLSAKDNSGSDSNNACSEMDDQSLFGMGLDEEAAFGAAAVGGQGELRQTVGPQGAQGTQGPPGAPGFAQWLARLEVLDALRHILQDDGTLCINSIKKVEAMLILKVKPKQICMLWLAKGGHDCRETLCEIKTFSIRPARDWWRLVPPNTRACALLGTCGEQKKLHARMHGCIHGCIHACIHACTHACTHARSHLKSSWGCSIHSGSAAEVPAGEEAANSERRNPDSP